MNALTRWWAEEDLQPWRMLAPWKPWREMETALSRMERAIAGPNGREPLATAEWSPVVDITEDDREYTVKADLPQVRKEDIKVTVQDGTLCITGERKVEKEEKGKKFHRIERAYGSFERSFTIPDGTDPNKITSQFAEGVLTVHLPKSATATPKSIEVKVA